MAWRRVGEPFAGRRAFLSTGRVPAETEDAAQMTTGQALLREAVDCARTTRWHPVLPGLMATAESEGSDTSRRAAKAAATLRDLGIRGAKIALRSNEIEEQIGSNESGRFEEGGPSWVGRDARI